MDQQGRGPAAWSGCGICGRQAAGWVGGSRQLAGTGAQQALLFRKVPKWKHGVLLGHVQ